MNRLNVARRNIGVVCIGQAVTIRVWAPMAQSVSIKWEDGSLVTLEKREFGYWTYQGAAAAGDKYMFIIDGKKELPDPASLYQPNGVHGHSMIFDPTVFEWGDSEWKNPPIEEYIFYELHTGTFTSDGTFEAIEEKLDHLLELGVTAIEIMPVGQFPGDRNWGYDVVFPFAVQNSYGGPLMLQRLIDKCHRKGIAVVLDVVYNHLGPEGNYLREFGPYFTDRYKTPWGEAVNYDGEWSDGVRDYVIENVLMWLRDFHIDALRLDAVHAIKDLSAIHILREVREHVDRLSVQTGKKYHLVVECDLNDSRFIDDTKSGGYGMTALWNDDFHHALRVSAGGETKGYYSDFNGVADLAKSYGNAFVYDGVYSLCRKRTFGMSAGLHGGERFIVCSQNHDQVGNRMLGERTSALVSFEMLKLLAGAVMVSPFLPLLFMGEEWGTESPFQYFISHSDTALVEAVRKGRKEEFAHFYSNETDVPDPHDEKTFTQCKLNWEEIEKGRHTILYEYYRQLILLRKGDAVLRKLSRQNTAAYPDTDKNILVLRRWNEQQGIVCILNFSGYNQDVVLPFKTEKLVPIFSSAEKVWGGPGTMTGSGEEIIVLPESLTVYSYHHV